LISLFATELKFPCNHTFCIWYCEKFRHYTYHLMWCDSPWYQMAPSPKSQVLRIPCSKMERSPRLIHLKWHYVPRKGAIFKISLKLYGVLCRSLKFKIGAILR
jgi:hypothetical protein